MSKLCRQLLVAAGVAMLAVGSAVADDGGGGDSGDNSMSQWTGESYSAFHGGNVGDFYTARDRTALSMYPAAEPSTEVVAFVGKRGRPVDPFRDDTGA